MREFVQEHWTELCVLGYAIGAIGYVVAKIQNIDRTVHQIAAQQYWENH